MTTLLIQSGSNHIYVATPELLKRSDMSPYDRPPCEPIPEPPAMVPVARTLAVSVEALAPAPEIEPQAGPDFGEVVDDDGMRHVRAELEEITEAEELVAHVFKKYNIKLNPAMKKSNMILRVVDTLKEREAAA